MQLLPHRLGDGLPAVQPCLGRQCSKLTLNPVNLGDALQMATALRPPSRSNSSNLRLACARQPAAMLPQQDRFTLLVDTSV